MVETQTSGSFMRAKVSRGPPRHAAQEGLAGGTQPAAAKISAAVLPSQPGTGSPYTSAHTCEDSKHNGHTAGTAFSCNKVDPSMSEGVVTRRKLS